MAGRDFPLRRGTASYRSLSHLPPSFYPQVVVVVVVPVGLLSPDDEIR
jgi:hypothetical protein